MAITSFDCKLNWAKKLTHKVLHLSFSLTENKPFSFIPGQFITFLFEHHHKIIRRSYSIASLSQPAQEIEIAVSPVENGLATEILFNLKPGEILKTTGPFGRLILPQTATHLTHIVLAATGTGITPYRAMLPQLASLLNENKSLACSLLFNVRYRQDLFYLNDFLNFKSNRFYFQAYLSQETQTQADYEKTGRIIQAFHHLNLDPQRTLIYLCGHPEMIDETFSFLIEKGFASSQVRREKYISS